MPKGRFGMVESDGGALGSFSLALLFRAAAAPVCYESLWCWRWRLLRRGRMLRRAGRRFSGLTSHWQGVGYIPIPGCPARAGPITAGLREGSRRLRAGSTRRVRIPCMLRSTCSVYGDSNGVTSGSTLAASTSRARPRSRKPSIPCSHGTVALVDLFGVLRSWTLFCGGKCHGMPPGPCSPVLMVTSYICIL